MCIRGRFYTVPGATEQSAMASAEGQVQHLNYKATFPLLLNISNRPTYFISLKAVSYTHLAFFTMAPSEPR